MASRWIVSKQGTQKLAFSELVELARQGKLVEHDLVKADWEPEWRPASTVVGLFQRAQLAQHAEDEPVTEIGYGGGSLKLGQPRVQTGVARETSSRPTSGQLRADAVVLAADRKASDRVQRHYSQSGEPDPAKTPLVFRFVCAIVLPIMICVALAAWSRQAALRFPKPGMPDRYVVPVLGDCSPIEFSVVLFDLAIVLAVIGYAAAKRIETVAE